MGVCASSTASSDTDPTASTLAGGDSHAGVAPDTTAPVQEANARATASHAPATGDIAPVTPTHVARPKGATAVNAVPIAQPAHMSGASGPVRMATIAVAATAGSNVGSEEETLAPRHASPGAVDYDEPMEDGYGAYVATTVGYDDANEVEVAAAPPQADDMQARQDKLNQWQTAYFGTRIPWSSVRVGGKLGSGAFGQVFQGEVCQRGVPKDVHDSKDVVAVALKELDPASCNKGITLSDDEMRKSFMWEAARASGVQHAYILRFLGAVLDGPRLFMVFPLCTGGDLHSAARPGLHPEFVWSALLQLASALAQVHSSGMIHKDVKSENCLLSEPLAGDGEGSAGKLKVFLSDLGVAQVDSMLMQAEVQETKEVSRGIKDFWWGSPEEFKGDTVTSQSDVYGWALVAYHCMTGDVPWAEERTQKDGLVRVMQLTKAGKAQSIFQLPSTAPPRLVELVLSCLAAQPTDRPTATGVVEALLALAPDCFRDHVAAANAVLMYHKEVALHASIDEQDRYLPVVVTPNLNVRKVPHSFHFSFGGGGDTQSTSAVHSPSSAGECEELPVTAHRFLIEPPLTSRVLALIGDGGTGKSLFLERLALQEPKTVPLRLAFDGVWSWSVLRNGIQRALQSSCFGLSEAAIEAMKQGSYVFLLDAVDELAQDATPVLDQSIPDLLGLHQWPNSKLIITSRRHALTPEKIVTRLGNSDPSMRVVVRYLLPFAGAQIRRYLSINDSSGGAALSPDQQQVELLQNPYLLRLFVSCSPSSASAHTGRVRVHKATDIYDNVVRQWAVTLQQRLSSCPVTLSELVKVRTPVGLSGGDRVPDVHSSFVDWASSVAGHMFLAGAVQLETSPKVACAEQSSLPQNSSGGAAPALDRTPSGALYWDDSMLDMSSSVWARLEDVVAAEAADVFRAQRVQGQGANNRRQLLSEDQFVTMQRQLVRQVLSSCPLKRNSTSTRYAFTHKTMRDYFCALALTRHVRRFPDLNNLVASRHVLTRYPVTSDVAVQELTGELVDVVEAQRPNAVERLLVWARGEVPNKATSFEEAAWDVIAQSKAYSSSDARSYTSSTDHPQRRFAVAAANCLTILNTAGVSLSGLSLRRACLGDAAWKEPYPFMDLGGALLHSTDLSEAIMCGCRLQQACLDHTKLTGAVLEPGVRTGELPMLLADSWVTALMCTRDGHFLCGGSRDAAVRVWRTQESSHESGSISAQLLSTVKLEGAKSGVKAVAVTRSHSDSSGQHLHVFAGGHGALAHWILDTTAEHKGGHDVVPLPVRSYDQVGNLNALGVTGDGSVLFSAEKCCVRQWDVSTGTCVRTLGEHTQPISALIVGPSDAYVFSASQDKTVKQWLVAAEDDSDADKPSQCVRTLEGHTREVTSLALEHTGNVLYSGSVDKTIRRWPLTHSGDLGSASQCVVLSDHTAAVYSLAVSGDTLFSGSSDRSIRLWDLAQLRAGSTHSMRSLLGHTFTVSALALSRSGILFSASRTLEEFFAHSSAGSLKQWNVMQGSRTVRRLPGHTKGVKCAALCADGQSLLTGSFDGTVKVWSFPQGQCRQTLIMSGTARQLASVPDDVPHEEKAKTTSGPVRVASGSAAVRCVCLAPGDVFLLTGADDGTVRQWVADAQRQFHCVLEYHLPRGGVKNYRLTSCVLAPDLSHVVAIDSTSAYVCRLPPVPLLSQYSAPSVVNIAPTTALQVLPDCRESHAAAMSADGELLFASRERYVSTWIRGRSKSHARRGSFSVASDDSGTAPAAEEYRPFKKHVALRGHNAPVTSVTVRAIDGANIGTCSHAVFSGAKDGEILQWRVASACAYDPQQAPSKQEALHMLKGHKSMVWSVVVAADGHTLWSASEDLTIRQWCIALDGTTAPVCARILYGHSNAVNCAVPSLDGHWLFSGAGDRQIRRWKVEPLTPHDDAESKSEVIASPQSSAGAGTGASVVWCTEPFVLSAHDAAVDGTAGTSDLMELLNQHGSVGGVGVATLAEYTYMHEQSILDRVQMYTKPQAAKHSLLTFRRSG